MAYNFEDWVVSGDELGIDKWGPAAIALTLMMEGLRKSAGKIIAGLVWVLLLYGFVGDYLPGVLEAAVDPPAETIHYLYYDNNGVPGLVLQVVLNLVLAFIIFGNLMEVSGGTAFLTDLAMGWMGHRRGGPAKVAVVASSAFGTISGSTVGNIMSTGIVTIPLMKKTGFKPEYAGAIEAVASNGGQIAPPVMGATAFIIAEFLEVPYQDVVIAAAVPALLYFLVLFIQVDAVARRFSIRGLPKADLPIVMDVLKVGWVFILPIAILMYFLFWLGYPPGVGALYSAASLVVLMVIRDRRPPSKEHWKSFLFGSGEILVPLILIAGAAGIILGVMNATGLAFQLSIILTHLGEDPRRPRDAAADVADLHHSRNGDADRDGLYRPGVGDRPGADKDGPGAHGRPSVPVLFRPDQHADPAGRDRVHGRGGNGRRGYVENRLYRRAARRNRIPAALSLGLQSGAYSRRERRLRSSMRSRPPISGGFLLAHSVTVLGTGNQSAGYRQSACMSPR